MGLNAGQAEADATIWRSAMIERMNLVVALYEPALAFLAAGVLTARVAGLTLALCAGAAVLGRCGPGRGGGGGHTGGGRRQGGYQITGSSRHVTLPRAGPAGLNVGAVPGRAWRGMA